MSPNRNLLRKAASTPALKLRTSAKHAFAVSEAARTELKRLGKSHRAKVGEIVCRKGEPRRGVFLIVSGRMALSTDDDPIGITRIGEAGSVVGVPATINNRPYSLTAEAVTQTDLIQVGVAEFKELLRTNSDLCYSVVSMLSEEIRALRLGGMLSLNVRCAGNGTLTN